MGIAGDFGPNTSKVSHHITESDDPTPEQCLVCHDLSAHSLGTVRLRHADTGEAIVYDSAVPSSLEPFCLSCHDDDGATLSHVSAGSALNPFNDGSTLGSPPYPYATRIAQSWLGPYGHGPNGNHADGAKLTCFGTGQPGTGCHGNGTQINAHGSSKELMLSKVFSYTYQLQDSDKRYVYNENQFFLCFDCHDHYPGMRVTKKDTLGVKAGGAFDQGYLYGNNIKRPDGSFNPPYYTGGVTTHFVDQIASDPSCSLNNGLASVNLHWYHLGFDTYSRGMGTTSGAVCVTCHDVHGSTIQYGAVYEELGYSSNNDCGPNKYGEMASKFYSSSQLSNRPTYCAANCHSFPGSPTRAWYSPITE
jgi:hypothetical protein